MYYSRVVNKCLDAKFMLIENDTKLNSHAVQVPSDPFISRQPAAQNSHENKEITHKKKHHLHLPLADTDKKD